MGKARRERQEARRSGAIAIGYIHPGQVSAYFLESLIGSLMLDVAKDMMGERPRVIRNLYQEWSSANISASRNIVTQRFLDMDEAEWLLWIDSDMQWDPRDIDILIASADPVERPIVGGLCYGMAHGKLIPTIYQFAQLGDPPRLTTVRVEDYPSGEMIKCAATGAAFILIHRSVLVAMKEHGFNEAFPFFQETQNGPDPVGEDITFCIRAASLGFPTHVNAAIRVGHHKSIVLDEPMFREQQRIGEDRNDA